MSGLTRQDIDDILRLIDGSDFDELKLEMGDLKLELRRRGAAPGPTQAAPAPEPARPAPAPEPASGATDVPAPLLGTFYHAPGPGEPTYVSVGDTVAPDTIIGLIEVMKLMNTVPAGVSGVVTEFVAPNGEMVEYGQTLIRVRTA